MVKKAPSLALMVILLLWACATYHPPPVGIYIGSLPQTVIAHLSLDERIIAEDAWRSLKQGNAEKAKKIIAKLGSENPIYFSGLGYAYYILNDLQTAEDFFKAAVLDHPDLIIGHLGLGQIYEKTGREDLAFSEYREILKHEPDHFWARPRFEQIKEIRTEEALNEGKVYRESENFEASKTAYLRALYYSPQATIAHVTLAELYIQDDQYENALVHLKAAYANEPQDIEILKTYGEALFQAGKNKESLDIYEQVLESDPDSQQALDRIASLKNRLGIFELPSQYNLIAAVEAVTKQQMAALIGVKFKTVLEEPPPRPPIIIDISTSWASKYILQTTSLGILEVYPNHTFQPNKIITRAEIAETLNRLINVLKLKGHRFIQQIPPERIQIEDVSPDNFYYSPIVMMISYDIMSLSFGQKFNPDQAVSGGEAIRLLDIILALIE